MHGLGTGWENFQGKVWPNPDGVYVSNYCDVVSVTSSTKFTINAASAQNSSSVPIPGVTKIQWINRSGISGKGWQIITAKVGDFF